MIGRQAPTSRWVSGTGVRQNPPAQSTDGVFSSRRSRRAPLLFGLTLLLAACGSPGETSRDSGGDDTNRSEGAPAADSGMFDGDDAIEVVDSSADAEVDPAPASGSPLRALAIATGILHSCAILENHRVKCWGGNAGGGLLGLGDKRDRGAADEMGDALPFVDLGTGRTAVAIATGHYATCAILDTGTVKCWGARNMAGLGPADGSNPSTFYVGDEPGEMGDALPPLDLGPGRKATHLACAHHYSCAALDDGTARCWGADLPPLLPAPSDRPLRSKVRQLAVSRGNVVAIYDDDTISERLMGVTSQLNLTAGQKVLYGAGSDTRSCFVLHSGGVLCEPPAVGLPRPELVLTDLVALDIQFASSTACGLSRAGAVRCWGAGACAYPPGSSYWCSGQAAGDESYAVALGQPAVAIGNSGGGYSCAVLADGGVKCWGSEESCSNQTGGAVACAVPPTPSLILGGSVDIVGSDANRRFGAWRSINLGTHP